eukprot:943605-Pelagomonas_calceolata.AAC.1
MAARVEYEKEQQKKKRPGRPRKEKFGLAPGGVWCAQCLQGCTADTNGCAAYAMTGQGQPARSAAAAATVRGTAVRRRAARRGA